MSDSIVRKKEMALLTQQGYSLNKIAQLYGISRQRVHQILKKAEKAGCDVKKYIRPKKIVICTNCVICKQQFSCGSTIKKTCSDKCLKELRIQLNSRLRGGTHSRYEFISLTCKNCNKTFQRSKHLEYIVSIRNKTTNRFCSRICFFTYRNQKITKNNLNPKTLYHPQGYRRKELAMSYKELTPENLSSNQAKYFQPSKALPYKDYIIDKSLQGMTPTEIHKKLLEEFPQAQDVSLDSLKRMVKKHNQNKPKSKTKTITKGLNKSDEVRKLVKEMIRNGVELNGSNIIKTLANRGIVVSYTHAAMAIGQAVINNEFQFSKTQTPKLIKENPAQCSFTDLLVARELIEKLGGLDNTINAISAYAKFTK